MEVSTILFDPDGTARAIYSDEAAPVMEAIGTVTTRRASHVEPLPGGGWGADLGPVGGPVLGAYRTRREALEAEVRWLEENGIPVPKE